MITCWIRLITKLIILYYSAFSTILMTISYILYASANAIGQIAGAQILYSVGATGLSVCII